MDDFVRDKLTEWGLSNYIEKFQDGKIDEKSLYCLEHEEIKELIPEQGPRSVFKQHLKELKACQPANDKVKQRKRKLDLQGEGRKVRVPSKRQRESLRPAETALKSEVKRIMESVYARITNQVSIKLKNFLQEKIKNLETDKREQVGVFGRTGAGKSSLINAVIGEDLLPSGEVKACTTVMIKVEASMDDKDEFRAEIEFIKKEDWASEFWALQQHIIQNAEDDTKDDDDIIEKLSAVYGENWRGILVDKPMDSRHFREIPEFLKSEFKTLKSGSAEELSEQLVKYTRNDSIEEEDPDVKRAYWPLVKCVTIRVPNNDFLQHVTLVDLPGYGDHNKSRDEMWRGIVGNCSKVWIVTETNRAASDKETWEMLEEISSLIGNGGECRHICFICTKLDQLKNKTLKVKDEVKKKFNRSVDIKKHFSGECLDVFTVSSREYFEGKRSQDNEIPKLQEFLKKLNDCHSETLNYVSGAHGILSLIEGARLKETATVKTDVCEKLEENMRHQLTAVKTTVEPAYNTFERCLSKGVEQSRISWGKSLESILKPKQKGINFQTLRCIVENGGIHKTGKGKQINLNMKLASCLLDSIDDEFRKTFPNEGKDGPFYGAINRFTLNTEGLIQGYKEVELHLIFLKTEEENIKKKLNKIVLDGKKIIYNSLTKKIEEIMEDCYKRAAEIEGPGAVTYMTQTIESHVKTHMYMFEQAKEAMLKYLRGLKMYILEKLEKTMMESIELSLKTDDHSLPDVSDELEAVKKLYDELKGSSAEGTSNTG